MCWVFMCGISCYSSVMLISMFIISMLCSVLLVSSVL